METWISGIVSGIVSGIAVLVAQQWLNRKQREWDTAIQDVEMTTAAYHADQSGFSHISSQWRAKQTAGRKLSQDELNTGIEKVCIAKERRDRSAAKMCAAEKQRIKVAKDRE